MEDETRATDLRGRYERFARIEADPRSPLYADWARGVASDDEVIARIESLPAVKQQANLIFASARFAGVPLAPWVDIRDDLLERWDAVATCAHSHSTQTNEARRLATLLPALGRLPQPFALVEVGASAGLCLYPDRWRYDFGGGRTVGDPETPVLSTRANATTPVPDTLPQVAWRAGLDLEPLDVSNDDDVRWLETLIWPVGDGHEDAERLDRLHAAATIARATPPRIERGDLVTDTERLIAEASRHADHVVVFHSAVLAYLPEDGRAEFSDLMASAPATWIANEGLGIVAGTDRIPDAALGAFAITVDGQAVALADPHGSWLTWLIS